MSDPDVRCPKCREEMERGYTIDISQAVTFTGQFVKGVPKRSWVDFFQQLVIKTPNFNERIPIATFRCKSCGFLESYARDEFRPK